MHTEQIVYHHERKKCLGFIAYENTNKKPAVLIAHAYRGQDDFVREKAMALATMGYVGFAIDLYGDGKSTQNNETAAEWMAPFFFDRKLLREHMQAAYACVCQLPYVNAEQIGAMGFCFGGLATIELFKSGVPLSGAVSFHGMLGTALQGKKAKTLPMAKNIKGSLLILHGHDDPLASQEDIQLMQHELTEAHVDWQMHIYGGVMHAFTNPMAHDPKMGNVFNAKANYRSWQTMQDFFNEMFRKI